MAHIDFNTLTGGQLVHAYNEMVSEVIELRGSAEGYRPVARFADHVSAVRRCEAMASSLQAVRDGLKTADSVRGDKDGYAKTPPAAATGGGFTEATADELVSQVDRATDTLKEIAKETPAPAQPAGIEGAATSESEDEMAKRKTAAAARARTNGARKRVEGRMTLKEQMDHFNSLVPRAVKKGISVKVHTSTFESYDKGVKAIDALEKKISAA
jgi:hypothetical protein